MWPEANKSLIESRCRWKFNWKNNEKNTGDIYTYDLRSASLER